MLVFAVKGMAYIGKHLARAPPRCGTLHRLPSATLALAHASQDFMDHRSKGRRAAENKTALDASAAAASMEREGGMGTV